MYSRDIVLQNFELFQKLTTFEHEHVFKTPAGGLFASFAIIRNSEAGACGFPCVLSFK